MRSYQPEELFDKNGTFLGELKALAPKGHRRMGTIPTPTAASCSKI